MTISITEYNANVDSEQKRHGKIDSAEPQGIQLPKEMWREEIKEGK
jgi:hypothetical protein